MNGIYKLAESLLRIQDGSPASRRIAGESCDYIPDSHRRRRRRPRRHASEVTPVPFRRLFLFTLPPFALPAPATGGDYLISGTFRRVLDSFRTSS